MTSLFLIFGFAKRLPPSKQVPLMVNISEQNNLHNKYALALASLDRGTGSRKEVEDARHALHEYIHNVRLGMSLNSSCL
jgi:hypothetical protein